MTRVLIVDDHRAFADGLAAVLRRHKDLTVVGIANNGLQALEQLLEKRVDVVVLDLELPDIHGLEIARRLRAQWPDVRIIVLTAYANPNFVLRAREFDTEGYLLKEEAASEVAGAIQRAMDGRHTYSPGICNVDRALQTEAEDPEEDGRGSSPGISDRQRDVLRLVADGKTLRAAADELGIKERTARIHWYAALDRLGLRTLGPTQVRR